MAAPVHKVLTRLEADVRSAVKDVRRFAKENDKLSKEVEKLNRKFAKAEAGLDELRDTAGKVGNTIKGLGLGLAAAGTALGAFAKSAADSGSEMARWSKRIGTSTKEIQRLKFAAEQSGSEFDNIAEGVLTFRENLGELQRVGTGPAVDSLMSLGISLKDIIDLPVEKQMGKVADAFAKVATQEEKLSIALEVFGGDDGKAMLTFLEQGSAGIKALGDEAERAGVIMSEGAIAKSVEMSRQFAVLEGQVNKLKVEVGSALLPVVQDIVRDLGAWVQENEKFLRQEVPDVAREVADALTMVAQAAGEVLEMFGGPKGLVTAIVGVKAGLASMEIASTAAQLGLKGMGAAVSGALGPIGALITAMSVLIPLAIELGNEMGDIAFEGSRSGLLQEGMEARAGGRRADRGPVSGPANREMAQRMKEAQAKIDAAASLFEKVSSVQNKYEQTASGAIIKRDSDVVQKEINQARQQMDRAVKDMQALQQENENLARAVEQGVKGAQIAFDQANNRIGSLLVEQGLEGAQKADELSRQVGENLKATKGNIEAMSAEMREFLAQLDQAKNASTMDAFLGSANRGDQTARRRFDEEKARGMEAQNMASFQRGPSKEQTLAEQQRTLEKTLAQLEMQRDGAATPEERIELIRQESEAKRAALQARIDLETDVAEIQAMRHEKEMLMFDERMRIAQVEREQAAQTAQAYEMMADSVGQALGQATIAAIENADQSGEAALRSIANFAKAKRNEMIILSFTELAKGIAASIPIPTPVAAAHFTAAGIAGAKAAAIGGLAGILGAAGGGAGASGARGRAPSAIPGPSEETRSGGFDQQGLPGSTSGAAPGAGPQAQPDTPQQNIIVLPNVLSVDQKAVEKFEIERQRFEKRRGSGKTIVRRGA